MDVIKETKCITEYKPLFQTVKENRQSYQNSLHLQKKREFYYTPEVTITKGSF